MAYNGSLPTCCSSQPTLPYPALSYPAQPLVALAGTAGDCSWSSSHPPSPNLSKEQTFTDLRTIRCCFRQTLPQTPPNQTRPRKGQLTGWIDNRPFFTFFCHTHQGMRSKGTAIVFLWSPPLAYLNLRRITRKQMATALDSHPGALFFDIATPIALTTDPF
ncbi:hypothetical protein B0O80DRAFT_423683 [Mortierella sp. GBAus27b]|nr:hypothetical protein B0O80DRAFT_423683 [Mortierella sp. GBAus27b]